MNRRLLFQIIFALAAFGHLRSAAADIAIPQFTADGFAVPQPCRSFVFPRDHGSHPEFAIEWWYVTGHLFDAKKTEYGFQATFFRRALATPANATNSLSTNFANDQIFLAHAALVNQATGAFLHEEKFNRAGWDAASATNTMDVRNGNWSLRLKPEQGTNVFALAASVGGEAAFSLKLTPTKPLVIFGTNGVSRKAAELTAASHYLTYSRLAVQGTLTQAGVAEAVTGEAWMDHEFSSSQLGAGQVGWGLVEPATL